MRVLIAIGLVLLVIAGAGAVNYFRPIPPVSAKPVFQTSDVVPGTPPALPWPNRGWAAVAVSGLGFIGSSGNEQAIPAASVTKVMTALLVLEDRPLKKGDAGPTITLTDADVQDYQAAVANKESVVPVQAGEQLTEFEALEGLLIPSGNNLAQTLARWDAGSVDAFVARMNTRASALHMSHTKFGDPSGASPTSVSTPTDLMRLGMAAMQTQEVLVQIVATGQAELPVAGTVYNVDAVLGQNGIFGIKTGSGLSSGANFLFAANVTVDGHTIAVYGCVMGQQTLAVAFERSKALIAAMQSALHVIKVLARNETVARYVTAWGAQTDLVSAVDVDLAVWPGMVLRTSLDAKTLVIDKPLAPTTVEGTEHIVLGDYVLDVPLVTATPLYPPGRFWRLTRLTF
jgi:D-alanyl-D-alanine carboxypeptidase (penicillin-binding protein 5/6)